MSSSLHCLEIIFNEKVEGIWVLLGILAEQMTHPTVQQVKEWLNCITIHILGWPSYSPDFLVGLAVLR